VTKVPVLLLVLALAASGCRTVIFDPPWARPPRYKIIAYVFGGRADIHRINARKLTHINYAFGLVSEQGEIVFREPDGPAHLAQLQALKARNQRLKIILSVGGWGADNFSDAALTEVSRQKFAASAITLIRKYALDGVDLDWEYPGQPGPGIKYRPEDKQNFTLLLGTLRQHLDGLSEERGRAGADRYLLTIASSGDQRYFANTEMDRLHIYLDWINIMTYDFAGAWSATTGHHAGLYWNRRRGDPSLSTAAYVWRHFNAGIPLQKLVVGLPFYGKGWSGVHPEDSGLNQPYQSYAGGFPFSVLFQQYIDRQGFTRYWDRAVRASYLWNAGSGTFITYEDPRSVREKARYVKLHRLGGVMYWEHSHDPDEILLNVLFDNLR